MAKAKKGAKVKETASTDPKQVLKDAKAALAAYYKENKLKKTEDYSADEEHGKKIARLEANVEKAQNAVGKTKKEKPTTNRATKYEYPADIDTPEKRKKYRQEMRAKAAGKTKKEKPAKEKPAKEEKPAKATKTKTAKADKVEAKGKKTKTKKVKKAKKVEDD